MIFGVDTASVAGNTNVSWTRAKAEGPISFVFIRSNWGIKPDRFFEREWDRMKAAGLVAGAYMFLRFRTDKHGAAPSPRAQAEAMVDIVKDRIEPGKDFPPALDVEFPGKGAVETRMTAAQLLDGVREAWNVLKDEFGAAPIVYTSGRVWREDLKNLPAPDLTDSPLWLARYPFKAGKPAIRDAVRAAKVDPPVPTPWGDKNAWFIHQYQGDAIDMPGFPTGNVDMDRFNAVASADRGGHVEWIQRRLGMSSRSGKFDAQTEAEVRRFQQTARLTVDGVVGPRTFAALSWH